MWHGELDRIVPLQMARKVAKTLPNCKTNFLPYAGHYILFHCWKEILLSALF
jgi:pimeloyl-ACP methyl ester carboxylesterase